MAAELALKSPFGVARHAATAAAAEAILDPADVPVRHLLGLAFADIDVAATAALIARRAADAPFAYVVTPNADHLVRLSREPALAPLYTGAMLRLLDSRVVAHAARAMGLAAPIVAPGSDLTARLLQHHLRAGERITVVGMRPGDIAALVAATGISAPAHINPPIGFETDPAEIARTVAFVREHPARFIFLAVGSPRQERLAAAIARDGRVTGTGLCIGASLEFLAGTRPRAPRAMQLAGLEWLHRMLLDPRRLMRRYLVDNPPIFRFLWRERQERRRNGRGR
jgi:exopolysaccharide biosynthesis WecB/TagA/CpsF family protein